MAAPVWRASSHPGSAGERAGLLAAGSAGLRATPLLGRKQETELFPLSKNNLYIHNIINFWWWDNVPKPQYIELKTEENYLICSHWQKLVVSTLVGWLWTMHYFKPFCIISVGILNIRHYERPKLWTFDITSVLLQCFFVLIVLPYCISYLLLFYLVGGDSPHHLMISYQLGCPRISLRNETEAKRSEMFWCEIAKLTP